VAGDGIEPSTSRFSVARSYQLSYPAEYFVKYTQKVRNLILGTSGQDASFLKDILTRQGQEVVGAQNTSPSYRGRLVNRSSYSEVVDFDFSSVDETTRVLDSSHYDAIYNLVGFSSVERSFVEPIKCFEANYLYFQNLLIAISKLRKPIKVFQCSSSEMYAGTRVDFVDESSHLSPISPYGISKASAHYLASAYRNAYGVNVSTGILFNHESELRPTHFFSKKVVVGLVDLFLGNREKIAINNIHFQRDWSYAGDFAEAFSLIMSKSDPDDFVIASGELHSGEEFIQTGLEILGMSGKVEDFVTEDTESRRPIDHQGKIGVSLKAQAEVGWKPKTTFEQMVRRMIDAELSLRNKN
jgi:GDPmannose 4,6-dehydratase